ncbi:TetR/AcrR family transcriptional regulator [Paenibacillus sp. SYP-B3998]|uniref:TetR/AcrR family transcriptional regulator n=1 Tax=Paenibacillus sp. SYP-B3998 TaxID=2678564 RepID=A0A6G3ZYZ1_9BACL|nr:TetR family transcriptional regulator [Paenibacillus sp. SYP-B3998]NEW07436.1 TetR/AcrR family transcriptional regulator [Paenibacillus sp. SYP-B3998]
MATDMPLTKEAILDAAEVVLRRFGPEKTTVVDVAKALRVSHGALYRHFASKASLREAVTERWLQQIADTLEAIAYQSGGPALERLRHWIDTLIISKRTYAANDPEMFTMYTAVTLESVEMISAHINRLIQQLAQIVEVGIAVGEVKPGSSESIAKAIFMATVRFHHPAHAYEWVNASVDEEFQSVWQLVLSGIKTKTESKDA